MSSIERLRRRLARVGRTPPVTEASTAPTDADLEAARRHYGSAPPAAPIGYGTVADLADSRERLGWLAGTSFDMKSLQRCWALKTVLAATEPPGPLLEIGAGEPFVADALARLGYQVTIVDPYDGSGTGPTQLAEFRRRYPALRFVQDTYPSPEAEQRFAAIYSISVLEHLPVEAAADLARAARAQAGLNVHAIDHVIRGWGDGEHLRRLELLAGGFGLAPDRLASVLSAADRDPETYLVSAEAHEVWRGPKPYDEYAMRRICSVQVVLGG